MRDSSWLGCGREVMHVQSLNGSETVGFEAAPCCPVSIILAGESHRLHWPQLDAGHDIPLWRRDVVGSVCMYVL